MGYRNYVGIIDKDLLESDKKIVGTREMTGAVQFEDSFSRNKAFINDCKWRFELGNLGWELDNIIYEIIHTNMGEDLSTDDELELFVMPNDSLLRLANGFRQKVVNNCREWLGKFNTDNKDAELYMDLYQFVRRQNYELSEELKGDGTDFNGAYLYEFAMVALLMKHREFNPEKEVLICFGY